MATKADFIEYVREQLAGAGAVSYRRMFGEYAVYLDDRVVALVCDNQLFVKPTAGGRAFLGSVTEAPPFPGASMYFLVDEALESPQEVAQLIRITARELPAAKPKTAKKAKNPKAKVATKSKVKPKATAAAKRKAKPKGQSNAKAHATSSAKPKPKPKPAAKPK